MFSFLMPEIVPEIRPKLFFYLVEVASEKTNAQNISPFRAQFRALLGQATQRKADGSDQNFSEKGVFDSFREKILWVLEKRPEIVPEIPSFRHLILFA